MREALALAVIGMVAGMFALFVARRLIETQLFEIHAMDAGTLAAMAIIVLATALIACYGPARRAAHVDPTTALRVE